MQKSQLQSFRITWQRRVQLLSAAAGNLAVAQYAKRRSRAAFDAELLFPHPPFSGRLRCPPRWFSNIYGDFNKYDILTL